MKLPVNFENKLISLKRTSDEIINMMENKSFYELPYKIRIKKIWEIKRLYSSLKGPQSL